MSSVHDELARVRAELAAAREQVDRLRREKNEGRLTGCCRDSAAQVWAEIGVLRERLARAQATAGEQAARVVALTEQVEALRAQLIDACADAYPPVRTVDEPARWGSLAHLMSRRNNR